MKYSFNQVTLWSRCLPSTSRFETAAHPKYMSSVLAPSPTLAQHHILPDSITSHPPGELPKKKRKKRHREVGHEGIDGPDKKNKRKKLQSDTPQQTSVDPALLTAVIAPPAKRKKKKKDKEVQPAPPPVDPVQAVDDSDPQAAAAALISAIVAAATGTPDFIPEQQVHDFQPQVPSYMLPHPDQAHYIPYPFNTYPYNVSPFMPQNVPPVTLFPPTMNLPFSEMTFGSNDDVLRALQALDMSKITSVLKSLGDAAAAVSGQSPMEQPRPTPLGQVPAASGAILGHPPNESSSPPGHQRTLDMSLVTHTHQTNPDHAYLLANKWLNASKLTELARTEGALTLC